MLHTLKRIPSGAYRLKVFKVLIIYYFHLCDIFRKTISFPRCCTVLKERFAGGVWGRGGDWGQGGPDSIYWENIEKKDVEKTLKMFNPNLYCIICFSYEFGLNNLIWEIISMSFICFRAIIYWHCHKYFAIRAKKNFHYRSK